MERRLISAIKKGFLFLTLLFWTLILCSVDSLGEPILDILNKDGSVHFRIMYYWIPLIGLTIDLIVFNVFYTKEDFE